MRRRLVARAGSLLAIVRRAGVVAVDPAIAGVAAVGLTVLAVALRLESLLRRGRRAIPRTLWGPTPIINIRYASEALRRAGYPSTTLVSTVYAAYRADDFDHSFDDLLPRWQSPRTRAYIVFAWALRHADIHVTFFDGGYLSATRLRDIEGWLLRLAGRKLIVMPYGSDIAVPGYLGALEPGFEEHYPHILARHEAIRRRVTWYCRWADVVIRTLQPGFLPRADVFWGTALVIDIDRWARPSYGLGDERATRLRWSTRRTIGR